MLLMMMVLLVEVTVMLLMDMVMVAISDDESSVDGEGCANIGSMVVSVSVAVIFLLIGLLVVCITTSNIIHQLLLH